MADVFQTRFPSRGDERKDAPVGFATEQRGIAVFERLLLGRHNFFVINSFLFLFLFFL